MTDSSDGGFLRKDWPAVSFIVYGRIDTGTTETVREALESYIDSIGEELTRFPVFIQLDRNIPVIRAPHSQEQYYFEDMRQVGGTIKIGLTEGELYSPYDRRNLFGYGNHDGSGIFSLARFRKECSGKRLFYDRIGKQSIKVLSLALQVSSCSQSDCIVSYHRHVEDLDRNTAVCPKCQGEMIVELNDYLNPDTSQHSIPGGIL
jgi:predicted Zn-dependent protease